MAVRFPNYEMRDGKTELAEKYFNPILADIDSRIDTLEQLRISWDEATRQLNEFGLERIDSTISPVLAAAQAELAAAQADALAVKQLIEDIDVQGQLDAALTAQTAAIDQALIIQEAATNAAIAALQAELTATRSLALAGL